MKIKNILFSSASFVINTIANGSNTTSDSVETSGNQEELKPITIESVESDGESKLKGKENLLDPLDKGMQINRRTDVIYNGEKTVKTGTRIVNDGKMELRKGMGALWAVVDPIQINKTLNMLPDKDKVSRVDGIDFKINTNYKERIDRYELRIFSSRDRDLVKPLTVISVNKDELKDDKIHLSSLDILNFNVGIDEKLVYQLRVYDNENRYDETHLKGINFTDIVDGEESKENTKINDELMENDLALSNIKVRGNKVRIRGVDLNLVKEIKIAGNAIPVDENGNIGYEQILPSGRYVLDVEVTELSGEKYTEYLKVSVQDQYHFGMGLADLVIGQIKASGNTELLKQNYHYDGDVWADGRLAFYTKSRFKSGLLLTTQMDTEQKELKNLFRDFNERNPESIIDRQKKGDKYLTYGDDSVLIRDVDTQGKFYLRADIDKTSAVWGNYETGFTGTKYAEYNRSLYGAKIDLNTNKITKYGDTVGTLKLIGAEPETVYAHNEFKGTGGSLYYLNHTDIVTGSEKIWIEVLDELSGRVVDKIALTEGKDYEINYFQGRVMLAKPLSNAIETYNNKILKTTSSSKGNEALLKVDYEYIPDNILDTDMTYGARGKLWLGDHVQGYVN